MTSMPGDRQFLVTGATGFIGQALVRTLVQRGEKVIAASRKPTLQAPQPPLVEWRHFDLLQADSLVDGLAGVDVAYYLVHSMGSGQAARTNLLPVRRSSPTGSYE